MCDPVTAFVGEATKSVFTHGERELNYIFRFRRNIRNLGDNIAALEANIRDVRSWVDAARNNNHLIRKTVDTWLEQADRLFEEATQLKSEAGDINSWWKGWVTCSRFSLGRKAEKKNVDIQKHLGEGSKFGENNVSDPRPVQSYEPEPDGDFKTFASRAKTEFQVIAALRADKNSLVGIYGMPGVGKTMLMKAVMAQLKKEKVFDEVVMVVVSQKPDLEKIQDAIAEKLDLKFTGNLRLSYDFLQDETTKMCFLFCCMFPEDFEIPTDVLFDYMMGEKLIRDVDTFEEARNRLQATVEELTSAGLLLKMRDGFTMMHDVVRDVAVSIAKCEERNEFIVKAKMSLDEWPDMELEKCKRLSLMNTEIRYHLPSQIKAPNLLTLSLNSFNDLHEIPSNFFQEMTNLLTLDLSNTIIRSLPASLSSLTNLRTLRMNQCSELTNISPVVNLNRLEILCLDQSGIENFPEEMGSLTSLKSLNFFRAIPLYRRSILRRRRIPGLYTTISPKVISRLFRLEEFSGYIENLEFSSENANPWKKMTRFKISLGEHDIPEMWYRMNKTEFRRNLFLTLSSISISISHLIKVLLPKTIFLYLKFEGIENMLQLDKIEVSFHNLKKLKVIRCRKLVTLIPCRDFVPGSRDFVPGSVNQYEGEDVGDGVEQGSSSTRLSYLPPTTIFHNLTDLDIGVCNELKHLFH
ncbi:hypothetical protein IFM89_021934 [Coptis chinensis]|uniref:NB-ARC domain-containing protein n=1 Tax=Coptis chinensis TaxID=261450 RepID=A0A835LNF9_9MAGN|nr:hypothetical protein IFM89_021934 [Coptis chinensis]